MSVPGVAGASGQPAAIPRIACAIDASSEDLDMQALNRKVVEFALLIASCLESDSPTLLHAWVPFAERAVRKYAVDDEFAAYLEKARQRAGSSLTRIARSFEGQFDARATVLRRGEPQEVIPEFVVSEGIDMLVMGTVARWRDLRDAHREHRRTGAQEVALLRGDG